MMDNGHINDLLQLQLALGQSIVATAKYMQIAEQVSGQNVSVIRQQLEAIHKLCQQLGPYTPDEEGKETA